MFDGCYLHPHHRLHPPVHDDVGDCVPVTLNLHRAVLPEIQQVFRIKLGDIEGEKQVGVS